MKALPRGVVRGVADTIVGGDPSGVIRGMVIVIGLCLTTAGFVKGTLTERHVVRLAENRAAAPPAPFS
jgi:hypothetical protein